MRKVKKVKGKCFAEHLKLSLKPSTVLSTVTGELPEFHGNQTSAVSFWFRTSEKHLQKAPPQKIHTKNNKNSPPQKTILPKLHVKSKRFGQASGKIESFDIHDLCLCQQLKRIVFVWPRWECKDVIETLKHQTRHLQKVNHRRPCSSNWVKRRWLLDLFLIYKINILISSK